MQKEAGKGSAWKNEEESRVEIIILKYQNGDFHMSGKFLRVKCKCGNEQNLFAAATTKVLCNGCNVVISEPTGGRASITAKIIKELD